METEAFLSLWGEKNQTQKVLLHRQSPLRNLGECLIWFQSQEFLHESSRKRVASIATRSSFHGDHAQGCTFYCFFCFFVPFFIDTGRSAAQKKASREILFTPAGTDGTTGPMSAMPPGTHAHKQKHPNNQEEQSISKSCILDSWSKLLTTNTEQNVCRNVSKISPSSIFVHWRISKLGSGSDFEAYFIRLGIAAGRARYTKNKVKKVVLLNVC